MKAPRILKWLWVVTLAIGIAIGGDIANEPSTEATHSTGFMFAKWVSQPGVRIGDLDAQLDSPTEISLTVGRLQSAISTWVNVFGSSYDPYYLGQDSSYIWTGNGCTTGASGVITLVSVNISAVAETIQCRSGSTMTRATYKLDTTVTWYNGTSTSVPAGQNDFWSNATHELGHGGGFTGSHFTDAMACPGPGTVNQSTMCATTSLESSVWRTLSSHDISVFAAEY